MHARFSARPARPRTASPDPGMSDDEIIECCGGEGSCRPCGPRQCLASGYAGWAMADLVLDNQGDPWLGSANQLVAAINNRYGPPSEPAWPLTIPEWQSALWAGLDELDGWGVAYRIIVVPGCRSLLAMCTIREARP